ncbi:GNAT family protein [Streptomyces diacarni]|uniref:GNAT family N-acetyltransferase n=1 Tax=Streptomyces diacarni TaxID=2800381 RepID=UPI0033C1ADB1
MYPISRCSQRLALRELAPEDTDAVFAIYGSPEATEHLSFEPRSHDQVHEILVRSMSSAQADPRGEYALAVVERASSELIGFGRLATDPHQPRGATFGFALPPAVWGRGYGTETVQLLLGLGFQELGLHRIWGARSPLNEASARTMRTAGMTEEGRIREHVYKAGAWRDSIIHAIIDHEWQTVSARKGPAGA